MNNFDILERQVMTTFSNKGHLSCVLLDMEKAYDRVWRLRILEKLKEWGLAGNMFYFISNFLKDRSFQVAVGDEKSCRLELRNGIPQGSVLSVSLFVVFINSLGDVLNNTDVEFLMYADDVAIYSNHPNDRTQINHLNAAIRDIVRWGEENGQRFSPEKSKFIHFCKKRKCNKRLKSVTLENYIIQEEKDVRYLGMLLDKKWTWKPHVADLRQKTKMALHPIRCLKGIFKGSNRISLLHVLKSVIISKLRYGCEFYGSASMTTLNSLNSILSEGLRIATGAFRTTPVEALLAETNTWDLNLLRNFETIKRVITSPTIDPITGDAVRNMNDVSSRGMHIAAELEIPVRNVERKPRIMSLITDMEGIQVDISLQKLKKRETPNVAYLAFFRELQHREHYRMYIYTDGSKSDHGVGAAVTREREVLTSRKLPDHCSVFTTELLAIRMAIQWINNSDETYTRVCTDSASSLSAILNPRCQHPLVAAIRNELTVTTKDIILTWIPGHENITGNDTADNEAKRVANSNDAEYCINIYSDILKLLKRRINTLRQSRWHESLTKLREIKPTLEVWPTSSIGSRRENVVICRLRIGHSRLTHEYIFTRGSQPTCERCNSVLTTKHIVVGCPVNDDLRRRLGVPDSLAAALGDDEDGIRRTLKFIRELGLINKI